jgi:hypothetical protein
VATCARGENKMKYDYYQISREYGSALINLFDSVFELHNSGAIDVSQHPELSKALNDANEVTNKTFDKFKFNYNSK